MGERDEPCSPWWRIAEEELGFRMRTEWDGKVSMNESWKLKQACGRSCVLDVHILSVLSTIAFLLMTRTLSLGASFPPSPSPSPSPSTGCVSGGRMSAAFVTATDAGSSIGRMSWINGNKDAILLSITLALCLVLTCAGGGR